MSQDETGWQEFVDRACAALEIDPGRGGHSRGVGAQPRRSPTRGAPHGPRERPPVGVGGRSHPGRDLDYLRRVVEDAATSAPLPPEKEKK